MLFLNTRSGRSVGRSCTHRPFGRGFKPSNCHFVSLDKISNSHHLSAWVSSGHDFLAEFSNPMGKGWSTLESIILWGLSAIRFGLDKLTALYNKLKNVCKDFKLLKFNRNHYKHNIQSKTKHFWIKSVVVCKMTRLSDAFSFQLTLNCMSVYMI